MPFLYSWHFDHIIMEHLTPLVSWFSIYYDFNSQYCGVSLHKFDAQPLVSQIVQVEFYWVEIHSRINHSIMFVHQKTQICLYSPWRADTTWHTRKVCWESEVQQLILTSPLSAELRIHLWITAVNINLSNWAAVCWGRKNWQMLQSSYLKFCILWICAIRICNTEIEYPAMLVTFSCLSFILFGAKLTFVCHTKGLLFIMQLSLSALAIKKMAFKVLEEKSCSDIIVFWTVSLVQSRSFAF